MSNEVISPTSPTDSGGKPEFESPVEAWRLPISLRIVAFMFVLFGILSIVDVVLRWLLLSQIFINFGCLLVFVGWGLRRWSEAARGWAVFLTWATLVLLLFWVAIASYVALGGVLPPNAHVSGANLKGFSFVSICVGFLIWQLRVLGRRDIVWRFQNLNLAPRIHLSRRDWWSPRYWRFSLESLLLATTVIAFVIVDVQSRELWWNDSYQTSHSRSPDGREVRRADSIIAVDRFFDRPEQLRCLLLTRADDVGHSVTGRTTNSSDGQLIVRLFDDKEFVLRGDKQLYQIENGELRQIDARVTKTEFDKYAGSQPPEWSIEALVKFAELSRVKSVDENSTPDDSN